jgi:hypothetical protein
MGCEISCAHFSSDYEMADHLYNASLSLHKGAKQLVVTFLR